MISHSQMTIQANTVPIYKKKKALQRGRNEIITGLTEPGPTATTVACSTLP